MWPVIAFILLGFLVGNLAAFSATSVVISLIGLLFGLAGGSVIAFLHKLTASDRKAAAHLIASISFGCLLGVYVGVIILEHRLLTPREQRFSQMLNTPVGTRTDNGQTKASGSNDKDPAAARYWYLRGALSAKTDEIDARYRNGELTAEAAYEQLFEALNADANQ